MAAMRSCSDIKAASYVSKELSEMEESESEGKDRLEMTIWIKETLG